MSNAPELPVNGMTGLIAKIAQGTAVGVIAFILCVDILMLAPQREARYQAALAEQQRRADERYDRLLSEIVHNQDIAKQNGRTLDKVHAKVSEPLP